MYIRTSKPLEWEGSKIDRHGTNVMKPILYHIEHIELFGAEMLGCCLNAVKVLGYDPFDLFLLEFLRIV